MIDSNDFDFIAKEKNDKSNNPELEIWQFERAIIDYFHSNEDSDNIKIHVYATINKKKQDLNEELAVLDWNPIKSDDTENIVLFVKRKTNLPTGTYYVIAKADKITTIARTIINITNKKENPIQNENEIVKYNQNNNSIDRIISEKATNKISKFLNETIDNVFEKAFSGINKNENIEKEIKELKELVINKNLSGNNDDDEELDDRDAELIALREEIEFLKNKNKNSLNIFEILKLIGQHKDIIFPILTLLNPNAEKMFKNFTNVSGNNSNNNSNNIDIPNLNTNENNIAEDNSTPIIEGIKFSKKNFKNQQNKNVKNNIDNENNEEEILSNNKYENLVNFIIKDIAKTVISKSNVMNKEELYKLLSKDLSNNFFNYVEKAKLEKELIVGKIILSPIKFVEDLYNLIDRQTLLLLERVEPEKDKIKKLILESILTTIKQDKSKNLEL